ncbi:uncharacterized protein LOC124144372 [Haliotis rufescens]|uniref:uncharacterized protein LOC124144372 n=1 Tax=Haliotis rufescens TaxID=6454 RepID=UPI00201F8BF2|nr:uncharacterized protein LOC124144372 [Haliotis rufescens]
MSVQQKLAFNESKEQFTCSKMHKRVRKFFSKIDNSGQMDPLIRRAVKLQHLNIPGPSRFHLRSARDIHRVKLLEHYDADSYFSSQLIKRLRLMPSRLPSNAFLKLMEILVAIFDVYLKTKEAKHGKAFTKRSTDRLKTIKMDTLRCDDNNRAIESYTSCSRTQPLEKDGSLCSNHILKKTSSFGLLKFKSSSENIECCEPSLKNNKNKCVQVMSKADKSHNNPKSRKDNFVLTKQEGKGDEAVIRENPDEETVDIIKSKEHSRGRKRHLPSTKGDHSHRSKRANIDSSRDKSDCARARAWRKKK